MTKASLIWGDDAGSGELSTAHSPLDHGVVTSFSLLSPEELTRLVSTPHGAAIERGRVFRFAAALGVALSQMGPELAETLRSETGYSESDSLELAEGAAAYAAGFQAHWGATRQKLAPPVQYRAADEGRSIELVRKPYGTVAAILPQNAFLILGVTCLLNALATGNRIVLRAPAQSARSASLLKQAILAADAPSGSISVILARATGFLDACYRSPNIDLIHYMGSSARAGELISNGFQAGKAMLIDGDGNCWAWVGPKADVERAASVLAAAITRYHGQTCTSVNGIAVHPSIADRLIERLKQEFENLPKTMPLFDEAQASACRDLIARSGGEVAAGGGQSGNYLEPTLVSAPSLSSDLVSSGLFGPAAWIAAMERAEFTELWPTNRYPLCAAVFGDSDRANWASRLKGAARISFDGDSSSEHVFEPWGGYPASGNHPVSQWYEKYERIVQLDIPGPV